MLKQNEYLTSIKVDKNKKSIEVKVEFNKSLILDEKLIALKSALKFENVNVESFGISSRYNSNKNVLNAFAILYFFDSQNFIIKLNPVDKEHEIILYKSSNENKETLAQKIIELNEKIQLGKKEMNDKTNAWKYNFNPNDIIVIPKFKFNIEYDFPSFLRNTFVCSSRVYTIEKFYQWNAFQLNQNGAEVESVAIIGIETNYDENKMHAQIPQKILKFDKSFFLILKRQDQLMPYFAMWIVDSELMEKE